MREKWARRIVLFTGLLVLLLAIFFARSQNPVKPVDTPKSQTTGRIEYVAPDSQRVKRGRQIYTQQNCAMCHSIAGTGNPRNILDGIGTKRTAEELRNWITGADVLQGVLPESVRKIKQVYRKLPGDNLDALVIYMQSLRL